MHLMGQWAPGTQKANSPDGEGLGDKLGWFPFPSVDGGAGAPTDAFGGGNGFAVGKDAPPEAVEFLEYATSIDVANRWGETNSGILPVTNGSESSITDPYLTAVLDARADATYVQLYLDQAYDPELGAVINDAVAELFAGQAHRRRSPRRSRMQPRAVERPASADPQRAATDAPARQRGVGARRVGPAWRKRTTIVLFLLPALALYALLVLVPIGQGIYYSGFDWNGLAPLTDFVGLQNYRDALADRCSSPRCATSPSSSSCRWPAAALRPRPRRPAQPAPARPRPAAAAVLPPVRPVGGDHGGGLAAPAAARRHGRPHARAARTRRTRPRVARRPGIVLYTVFVVITWKYFGFHMILYLAGLQQIPRELEEAAALDGASKAQIFRHVTLPLLGPTVRISVFLSIIGSLQLFDLVWVMTGGGPVNASNTMAVYMIDRGFERSSSATAAPSP